MGRRISYADLNLFRALARHDGPWWGARDDELAALVAVTVARSGGYDGPADPFRVRWSGAAADKPVLLSWRDAALCLQSMS